MTTKKLTKLLALYLPYLLLALVATNFGEAWRLAEGKELGDKIMSMIQEEDSAEVNEMVRTAKVTPEQLAALLRQSATATPTPAALSAVGATFEKEVDTDED